MKRIKNYIEDKVLRSWVWLKSEKGQGLIEYALIIVLVAIAVIVALTVLADKIGNAYNGVNLNAP